MTNGSATNKNFQNYDQPLRAAWRLSYPLDPHPYIRGICSEETILEFIELFANLSPEERETDLLYIIERADEDLVHFITALAAINIIGHVSTHNPEECVELLERAIDLDDAYACSLLGGLYYEGNFVSGNLHKARNYLWLSVIYGCESVFSLLAELLEFEQKKTSEQNTAYWLYLAAAKDGEAFAQWRLGNLYLEGRLIGKSRTKGFTWLLKAANSGLITARVQLAEAFLNSDWDKLDPKIAYHWLNAAAESEYSDSYIPLAKMKYKGVGCEHATKQAEQLLLKAASIDPEKGYLELARLYLEPEIKIGGKARAYKTLLKAVDFGSAEACLMIADLHKQDEGFFTANKDTIDYWVSLAETFQQR